MVNLRLIFLKSVIVLLWVNLAQASPPKVLKDPTAPMNAQPQTTKPASAVKLVLNAIFRYGSRHTAVINGKTFTVGDVVNGHTIKTITANAVIFTGESRAQLRLWPEIKINITKENSNAPTP